MHDTANLDRTFCDNKAGFGTGQEMAELTSDQKVEGFESLRACYGMSSFRRVSSSRQLHRGAQRHILITLLLGARSATNRPNAPRRNLIRI